MTQNARQRADRDEPNSPIQRQAQQKEYPGLYSYRIKDDAEAKYADVKGLAAEWGFAVANVSCL